jgi:hypothetical protein
MPRQPLRGFVLTALGLTLAGIAGACDSVVPTDPAAKAPVNPAFAAAGGASVSTGTFTWPFPAGAPPVSAPCLGLEEPIRIVGTWLIRYHEVLSPSGRATYTEHLDYSDVALVAGELVWRAGPGATETIIWLEDDDGVRNITHVFHGRYLSQNGLPDLQVSHSVHLIWGPDGELRRDYGVAFSAKCVGSR